MGENNYVGTITWESKTKSQNTETAKDKLQRKTEYLLVYKNQDEKLRFNQEVKTDRAYPETDDQGVFRYKKMEEMSATSSRGRSSMVYPILGVSPREGKQWKEGQGTLSIFLDRDDVVLLDNYPFLKMRPEDEDKNTYHPFWSHFFDKEAYGTAETGLSELQRFFPEGLPVPFETVKPTKLLSKLLFHIKNKNALILDPFAGSASTFHAMLQANQNDNGNRKIIMIEQMEYSQCLTQERTKRVIDGVPTAKDAQLKEGLGGSFTAVTLGQAIDPLKILKGEDLPSREALARYLYYTLELTSLPQVEAYHPTGFFAESESRCYYLHYEASKEWFLTQGANLTASQLEAISKHANKKGKEAFVLAPAYYISKEDLPKNVIAHHIPYDIQRLVFNSSEED